MIVDDSYNANPASMSAALKALKTSQAPRKVAVLGEMLELGDLTAQAHAEIVASAAELDHIVCVGHAFADCATSGSNMVWFAEANDELEAHLKHTLASGDRVLFKGSNRVFWQHQFVSKFISSLESNFE